MLTFSYLNSKIFWADVDHFGHFCCIDPKWVFSFWCNSRISVPVSSNIWANWTMMRLLDSTLDGLWATRALSNVLSEFSESSWLPLGAF